MGCCSWAEFYLPVAQRFVKDYVDPRCNDLMLVIGVLSPAEGALYLSYNNGIGPYDGTDGSVVKYFIANQTFVDITPNSGGGIGYGGLSVDLQKPGTVMVAAMNEWYPDAKYVLFDTREIYLRNYFSIWRSLDGGATWVDL